MIDDALLEAEEKMEKTVSVAKEDFAGIRTGRAHPALFSKIMVDYYGTATPINQLASFHVVDARMISITPYDRTQMAAVERAIRDSDLGVNPMDDGQVIRVALPELTEERRREYIKVAKHKAEEAKVSIRNVRRHTIQTLEHLARDGDAGEDEVARAEKQLEAMTKSHVEAVDEILKHKEAELLEV